MKLRALSLCAAAAAVTIAQPYVSANFNGVSASPNALFPNTPTPVKFVADIAPDPKLQRAGVNLLRETNGVYTVASLMRDDGQGGDDVANDNKFTAVLTLSAAQGAELRFRVSAPYLGSLKRLQSAVVTVGVVDAVDLEISAGQASITMLEGESTSMAFTVTVSNQNGGLTPVAVNQTLTPSSGVSVVTDLPGGGFVSTQPQQVFLVQNTLTGVTAGTYTLQLAGTVTVGAQQVNASASAQIRVFPASGIGELTLASYPGALQSGVTNDVLFGAHYEAGAALPDSIELRRVDANGAFISSLALLSDNGTAGDLTAADRIYMAPSALLGGAAGSVQYFMAIANFPAGGSAQSPILALTSYPFPVEFTAINPASLVPDDGRFGRPLLCDQVLVRFNAGVALATIQSVIAGVGGNILAVEGRINTFQVGIPCSGVNGVWTVVNTLNGNPVVALASPNGLNPVDELTPNDARYSSQYAPPLVRADEAWIIARGSGITVAVLDTGVDYNHPDLAGRVVKGKDFVNNDNDPADDHSHGTHVAGIIAAKGNNSVGVAGMAWDATILAIKVCSGGGSCPDSAVIAGINAAATASRIINMSLGGPKSTWESLQNTLGFTTAYQTAVEAASANGVLVVVASGNANTSATYIPCSYPTVFCVGNTTSADVRYADPTYGSNYGAQVDIAAPGTSILSTVPAFSNATGYGTKTGTSMASPLVAGVAALVWANNPTWSRSQVEERLLKTAKPLPGQQVGPRVDAFDAVFNGNFEHELSGWKVIGTGSAPPSLGSISPTKDTRMGMVSTGPDAAVSESEMFQLFTVQSGVTQLKLSFSYAMVTEEYPEWVNRGFNDDLVITLEKVGGNQVLATETVDGSAFVSIPGIDFPGGDSTVGWTTWKSVSLNIGIAAGPGTYRLKVRDRGDGIYDTNGLIDNVRFR